jgi:hypothetical protein
MQSGLGQAASGRKNVENAPVSRPKISIYELPLFVKSKLAVSFVHRHFIEHDRYAARPLAADNETLDRDFEALIAAASRLSFSARTAPARG